MVYGCFDMFDLALNLVRVVLKLCWPCLIRFNGSIFFDRCLRAFDRF